MSHSRIPSPARSQGAPVTPRRFKSRTRSVGSPARSTTTGRLSALVQFKELNKDSFVLSPAPSRRSVLNDDTDIEEPRRRSWWKKLADNSRDVMEVLNDNKILETNEAVEEYIDFEVLSQEKKNYSIDIPESSDSESISSIVIPQRKLFTQKDQAQNKFGQLVGTRETLAKLHKSHAADKSFNVAPKNLFGQGKKPRAKPVFPAALLNLSPNKTANKTKENVAGEVKGQVRNLFGNRPGTKRKNMFADFIVSESEDEISEIQPRVFGFPKKANTRRDSANSYGKREHSPTSSVTTDIEMDDWKMLPSSTMVENQLEDMMAVKTPVKRARLSKLAETKESETKTTADQIEKEPSDEEQELKYDDDVEDKSEQNDQNQEHLMPDQHEKVEDEVDDIQNSIKFHNSRSQHTEGKEMTIGKNRLNQECIQNKSREHLQNISKVKVPNLNHSKIEAAKASEIEKNEEKPQKQDDQMQEKNKIQSEIDERKNDIENAEEDQNESEEGIQNVNEVNELEDNADEHEIAIADQEESESEHHKSRTKVKNKSEVKGHEESENNAQNQSEAEEQNESEALPHDNQLETDDNEDQELEDDEVRNDNEAENEQNEQNKNVVEMQEEGAYMQDKDENKSAEIQKESGVYEVQNDNNKNEQNKSVAEMQDKSANMQDKIKKHTQNKSANIQEKMEDDQDESTEIQKETENNDVQNDNEAENEENAQNESEVEMQEKSANMQDKTEKHAQNHSVKTQEKMEDEDQNKSDEIQKETEDDAQNESAETHEELEDNGQNESAKILEEMKDGEQNESAENQDEMENDEQNESAEIQEQMEHDEQDESAEIQEEMEDDEQNESAELQEEMKDGEQNESAENQDEMENDEQNESAEIQEQMEDDERDESAEIQEEIEDDEQNESAEIESEMEDDEQNESSEMEDDEHNETGDEEQNESAEMQEEMKDDEQNASAEIQEDTEDDEQNQSAEEDVQNESQEGQEETENEIQDSNDQQESDNEQELRNETHDTTGRYRKKNETEVHSPEAILHDKTNQLESFTAQGRNTSIRKTTMLKNLNIRPSLAPPRESTGLSDGTRNSSAEGSGWDSHRTTRKTLRQTFGRDFTPRKSLRALVMEKSAKRQTTVNETTSVTAKFPQANSTELPEASMAPDDTDIAAESIHDVSKRTRQTTLEMYLQKIKKQNMERKLKMEEAVRNSLKAPTKDVLNPFKVPSKPIFSARKPNKVASKPKAKPIKSTLIPLEDLPAEVIEDMKYKPPKRFQPSNASWITKRLYKFLESKLESKYDYKARVRAEKLVETIYHFAKDLRRAEVAPSAAVDALKHEMARLDVVKTHFDFYQFFHEYMPREIRVKVVPDVVNKINVPRHGVFSDIIRGNTVQG